MAVNKELWYNVTPKLIPKINSNDLEEMLSIIRPLKMVEENRFREILTDGVDRRRVAFTWEPKLGRPVQVYRGGLNDVTILTFHTWAFHGFFKPTLAEAYGCIRKFVPEWRAIRFFWLNSQGMDRRNIVGNFHWCPCVLFGEEMTSVIDTDWDAFKQRCAS